MVDGRRARSFNSDRSSACDEVGRPRSGPAGGAAPWIVLFGILLGPSLTHLTSQMSLAGNGKEELSEAHSVHFWDFPSHPLLIRTSSRSSALGTAASGVVTPHLSWGPSAPGLMCRLAGTGRTRADC